MTTNTNDPTFAQTIQSVNQSWIDALVRGNAADAAAVYSTDAQGFVPHLGLVDGRSAIQAAYQGAVDRGLRHVTLKTLELVPAGSLAYETGAYAILNDQGAPTESGHYLVIWRQEADGWRWHRHMWNYHFKEEVVQA